MGIRESLLNTITSVADSDFVRIVTSAGASSKATVRNLFKGFESNLGAKSSLTTSDYIRVVGSDNASYKQLVSDVAKKIIEDYTGSSLAGSSRSVKSALDSLNSNLTTRVTANVNTDAISGACFFSQAGRLVVVTATLTIPTGTANTTEIVTGLPIPSAGNIGIYANNNNAANDTPAALFLTASGALRLKVAAASNISARLTFAYVAG